MVAGGAAAAEISGRLACTAATAARTARTEQRGRIRGS
jgi:hypothetical protein